MRDCLGSCYSECDPWTSSINISWQLVRNANLRPSPRTTESESAFYLETMWFLYTLKFNIKCPTSSSDLKPFKHIFKKSLILRKYDTLELLEISLFPTPSVWHHNGYAKIDLCDFPNPSKSIVRVYIYWILLLLWIFLYMN